MIASKRTLGELIPGLDSISPEQVRDGFVSMGIEVASMKTTKPIDKLVTGIILDVKKHPNADNLNLCTVNVGQFGTRKIVCGAANVRKNLRVVVALEGAVLYGKTAISLKEIRGVESQGMICALDELVGPDFVSDADKQNIIELDATLKAGLTNVNELLFIEDTVYELELTANRPDLNGLYALSVELAAALGLSWRRVELNRPPFFKGLFAKNKVKAPRVNKELAPVFVVFEISQVKIANSSIHTQSVLRANGVKPINNVVDLTNLAAIYAAAPAHAYDADKISGRLHVRAAGQGEMIATLDNREYKLTPDDIVITDDNGAVALAGIVGGKESRVKETTNRVLFEIALFDRIKIKKTAQRTVSTHSSTLNAKPRNEYSVWVAYDLIVKELLQQYPHAPLSPPRGLPRVKKNRTVRASWKRIDRLLGFKLDRKTAKNGLKSMGFSAHGRFDVLLARAPQFRSDVHQTHDLVEELVKVTKLENVPFIAPSGTLNRTSTNFAQTNTQVVSAMLANRLTEVKTYNLTDEKTNLTYRFNDDKPFRVKNPASSQREQTRVMILGQLVSVVSLNLSHKQESVLVFETNPMQTLAGIREHVAAVFTGKAFTNRVKKTGIAADFFFAKGVVEAIGQQFGLSFEYARATDLSFAHPGKSAYVLLNGKTVGVVGELRPDLVASEQAVGFLELDYTGWKPGVYEYVEPSLQPTSRRDVSFVVDSTKKANELLKAISQLAHVKKAVLIDAFAVGEKQSFTASLTLQSETKTLSGETIAAVMDLVGKIIADAGGTVR